MAAKNQVTLTFAGDSDKLSQAFDSVGSAASKMDSKIHESSKAVDEHGDHLGKLGEKADGSERNLLGVHDIIDGTSTIMQGPGKAGIVGYIQGWADLAGGLAPVLESLAKTKIATIANTVATTASTIGQKIAAGASKAWAAAQWLLNAAMSANPIGIVVVAIGALIAIIVVIATKTNWFQTAWKATWSALKTAFSATVQFFRNAFATIVGFYLTLIGTAIHAAAAAFGWIPGIGGKLKSAAKAFDKFKDDTNRSLRGIKDKTIKVTLDTHKTGGASIGGIAAFAEGGIVKAKPGGTLALIGEAGHDEAVVPLSGPNAPRRSPLGAGVGGQPIVIYLYQTGNVKLSDIRAEVRGNYGGNVQLALGGTR